MTIGEICSRIRGLVKGVNPDSFLTNRFIYSVFTKHLAWMIRREDGSSKLMRMNSIIQTMNTVELVEVDTVSSGCVGVVSGNTIKRTKYKLPELFEGYYGVLIQNISSVDGSKLVSIIGEYEYNRISKNKYNKKLYGWYKEGYLYFPDIAWSFIQVSGIFKEDISKYNCIECPKDDSCFSKLQTSVMIPEYMMGEVEGNVLKEIMMLYQIPGDDIHGDNKSILK